MSQTENEPPPTHWYRLPTKPLPGRATLTWRPCKFCGAPITFVENPKTGKTVPVHLGTAKPQDSESENDPRRPASWIAESHFRNCPEAASFTRKRTDPTPA